MSLRITPAGAGKTRYQSPKSGSIKDHPRRCGENCVRYRTCERREGSPPQVRGKPIHKIIVSRLFGITPAGAGKTVLQCCIVRATADHPRGCGENSNVASGNFSAAGSPPRMRGKQLCFRPPTAENRITPADAGKTLFVLLPQITKRDHPRGCGENFFAGGYSLRCEGSPPRMRGKPR